MKPIVIHRQAVIDAACMFIGSAVGAAASAAFLLHRWAKRPIQGAPDPAQPGEPLK